MRRHWTNSSISTEAIQIELAYMSVCMCVGTKQDESAALIQSRCPPDRNRASWAAKFTLSGSTPPAISIACPGVGSLQHVYIFLGTQETQLNVKKVQEMQWEQWENKDRTKLQKVFVSGGGYRY